LPIPRIPILRSRIIVIIVAAIAAIAAVGILVAVPDRR
jgi:hypothetical protein